MRWPWQPAPESREASGGYTEIISRLVEAQAAGTTQQASATAATEAAAGALQRALQGATVQGPPGIAELVTPRMLGQCGRDLVRVGESCMVLRYMNGRMILLPASTWYFEGGADPRDWLCTATVYGPSGSSTWRLPMDSIVFVTWGSPTARPYHGLSPGSWSADTARLNANTERTLADIASGPSALLLTVPEGNDSGSDADDDPLAGLRADIGRARGKALLVETTASGYGEGKAAAPQRDFDPRPLHPTPDAGLVALAKDSFARSLAAAGMSPALFDDSDGTAKRESLRQWHLGCVKPIAKMIEHELSEKLDARVRLKFDSYPRDQVSRAQVFSKLIAAEGMSKEMALAISGLMDDDGDE